MQSALLRIWTRVTVSISYDDNHYTTGALSVYLYNTFILFSVLDKKFVFVLFLGVFHMKITNFDFFSPSLIFANSFIFWVLHFNFSFFRLKFQALFFADKMLCQGTLSTKNPLINLAKFQSTESRSLNTIVTTPMITPKISVNIRNKAY